MLIYERIKMSQHTELYLNTIATVEKMLKADKEWISRYKGYADDINNFSSHIKEAKGNFHAWQNLAVYLSVSTVVKARKNKVSFDLRYNGQSAGTLAVKGDQVLLTIKNSKNQIYCDYPEILQKLEKTVNWDSKEARAFRAFFKKAPKRKAGNNLEHDFESQLLAQFSKRKGDGKLMRHIQPVMLSGFPFQMPTPLGACKAKDGILKYAAASGRGCDILAHQGQGKGTYLTVIELKDEADKKEPAEKAISQAIAYATFLRVLLRTDQDAISQAWWKLFGFNGRIPKKLKIKVVVAMPAAKCNDTSFAKEEIVFAGSKDSLELHYIYFNVNGRKITSIQETSLSSVKSK
jgi:hypothetical protein